jgi:hypothetical protein
MLFLYVIATIFCNLFLTGITVELLFNWFVVPLGVHEITFVWALGLGCLVTAITTRQAFTFDVRDQIYSKLNIERPSKRETFISSILYNVVILGFGFVIHFFM